MPGMRIHWPPTADDLQLVVEIATRVAGRHGGLRLAAAVPVGRPAIVELDAGYEGI